MKVAWSGSLFVPTGQRLPPPLQKIFRWLHSTSTRDSITISGLDQENSLFLWAEDALFCIEILGQLQNTGKEMPFPSQQATSLEVLSVPNRQKILPQQVS